VPYLSQGDAFVPGRKTQIGIQFIADPVVRATLPQVGDRLTVQGSVHLDVNPIGVDSKKNDEVERLRTQVAALELALEGRLINLPAPTLLGRLSGTGTVETIPTSTFATPAQVEIAISRLLGGATQATLDTIAELAAALGDNPNFAATVASSLATKVDKTSNETIDGSKIFAKAIKTPYLEEDIVVRITTANWAANTWYVIPGLAIPFAIGEVRSYRLVVNYQYNDGTNSYNHWQMGGSCDLPGGIGWKAGGTAAEVLMILQQHSGNDSIYSLSFRSAIGGQSRGLEIKPNVNIAISGLGFIEFGLKRFL
jgi:hypothetical protein